MKIKKATAALLSAAISLCGFITALPASAASVYSAPDYRKLAEFVLTDEAEDGYSGDFLQDGDTNVYDMLLLKRIICGIYIDPAEEETLIEAPLRKFSTTTPKLGEARLCVFRVEFPDCKYYNALSAEEMSKRVFGEANDNSMDYPFESLTAFYERASYNNLHLDGDIYSYTAKNNRSYYSDGEGFEKLFMEALDYYNDSVDYTQYDVNKDGCFDGLSVSVPLDGINTEEDAEWWGFQNVFYYNQRYSVDGIKPKAFIVNDAQPRQDSMWYYVQVLAHELGHSMGLPDYYKYYSDDFQGMKGAIGSELMEDMNSDLSSFSKLMMGWLTDKDVKVASLDGAAQEFTLNDVSSEGSCLIVPVGQLDENYFSEYFLIEYITPTNNNRKLRIDSGGCVRILHINAQTILSPYDWRYRIFKYENYSPDYDSSDNGARVMRLVNDGDKSAFKTGTTISYGVPGFGAYDGNGQETVNPGFSVTIGQIADGSCTVTVTPTR